MSRIQGKNNSNLLSTTPIYVGIDVSKSFLDVYIHPIGTHYQLGNDKKGLKKLVALLHPHGKAHVVLEATGRYHRCCHQELTAAEFHVSVINPYRTRRFSDMMGQLAKTDKIDAKCLALFAAMVVPDCSPVAPAEISQLRELMTARRQLRDQIVEHKAQLQDCSNALDTRQLRARLRMCERHQQRLEDHVRELIYSTAYLKRQFDILTSLPGIALITAATLIAELQELGTANAAQIAALVGVAPMNRNSGAQRGQRKIRSGRQNVRNVLYMAAVSASRSNPDLARFYNRLRDSGKPFKVAITAVMRKLVILTNTLIKDNRKWETIRP